MHMTLDTDATETDMDIATMSPSQVLEEIELASEYASGDTCPDPEVYRSVIATLVSEGRSAGRITSAQAITAIRRGEHRAKAWDASCATCGHGFNWKGELSECPPCPKCGSAK